MARKALRKTCVPGKFRRERSAGEKTLEVLPGSGTAHDSGKRTGCGSSEPVPAWEYASFQKSKLYAEFQPETSGIKSLHGPAAGSSLGTL